MAVRGTNRDSGVKLATSANDKIFVEGPHGEPVVYWTRLIKTGNTPTPGMGASLDTGASGEDEFVTHTDKSPHVAVIIEADFGQLADADTAFAANDECDGIIILANLGAIVQSLRIVDPGANVNAWTPLTSSSGTAGKFKPITELTMETGSDTGGYQFQVNTLGTNAAAGTFILPRNYARQLYYLADPQAAYATVAMLGNI